MRGFAIAAFLVGAVLPLHGHAATRNRQHPVAYNHSIDTNRMILDRMAPADEYFGRQKESILEIRNRLDDLDRLADEDVSSRMSELDDLRDAILDWRHKYPHDPWLPRMLQRLDRDFQRAGGG
jgi:hypothetical protein